MRKYRFTSNVFLIVISVLAYSLGVRCFSAQEKCILQQYVFLPEFYPNPNDSTQHYLRVPPKELRSLEDRKGERIQFHRLIPTPLDPIINGALLVGMFLRSNPSDPSIVTEGPEPFKEPYRGKPLKPRQKARYTKEEWKPFCVPPAKQTSWEENPKFWAPETGLPFYFIYTSPDEDGNDAPFDPAPQMIPDGKGGYLEKNPDGGYVHHPSTYLRRFTYIPIGPYNSPLDLSHLIENVNWRGVGSDLVALFKTTVASRDVNNIGYNIAVFLADNKEELAIGAVEAGIGLGLMCLAMREPRAGVPLLGVYTVAVIVPNNIIECRANVKEKEYTAECSDIKKTFNSNIGCESKKDGFICREF